jgi:hypothetical protein
MGEKLRVISFKCSDETYNILRSKYLNFTELSQPIADEISQKLGKEMSIPIVYQTKPNGLYIYISQIEKNIDKLKEIIEKIKNEEMKNI